VLDLSPELRIEPGEWNHHLARQGRPQLIVGGPGTGKTEFLCRRVAHAVGAGSVDPSDVLVLGFSRDGVSSIRDRLIDLVGARALRITVATYHSLAMTMVESNAAELGWDAPPSILTGVEQERFVADLLATEDPAAWPGTMRVMLGDDVMAAEVTDFLLRASEQGLDADDVAAFGRDDWRALPAFIDRYRAALRSHLRIDYGLMLAEALRIVTSDTPTSPAYRLIVADEYQDTAPVQARLLLALAEHHGDLTVAADPYQSIYSFRGANVANVFSFPDDAQAALGVAAERVVLTTSFRVPEEILEAAVSVTARELPGGAGKVRSTRSGGSVACHEFGTIGDEADWIASDIERLHLADGVPLERIAVFVRSHGPFVADLARALDRRHIDHTHTDERLVDEPVVRFVHDLVRAACGAEEAEASLRRVLLGPFIGLPQGLVSTLPSEPDDWGAWMRAEGRGLEALADLIEGPAWCRESTADEGLWHVWSRLPHLVPVALDPEHERARRAWSAYAQVVGRISQRSGYTTLEELSELAVRYDFEADPLFAVREGRGVTIATMHRSKGTEFDAVYIADAVEGTLPDLRARDSMLGVRHLNPFLPTATAEYVTFRLDEERRLTYTAMTRSTSRVVVTATVGRDAGTAPSRFMRLVAPTSSPHHAERPLTPRSFVASVRRTVADPDADPVERLGGMALLVGGGDHVGDPFDRYGTRPRGSDTGFVTPPLRLSPSRAEAYDRCPRRYAVERHLLTVSDDSVHMRLGTLVHDVLERAEREAIDAGDGRSTLEAASRWLDDRWDGAGFGHDAVALAWKRRAHRILEALYTLWPSSAIPVTVEAPLDVELDGTRWSGRADRVEAHGDRLTVVDYKTSTSPVTGADAATSLQLGYYALAAAEHPEIARAGRVAGASYWYPAAKPTKDAIAVRHFDMANLDAVRERLVEIARAIADEQFPAVPNNGCGRCPVASTCPAMHEGQEAFSA
jgi:superfamily I DNA/RNA helicase/RecB family exonuclease